MKLDVYSSFTGCEITLTGKEEQTVQSLSIRLTVEESRRLFEILNRGKKKHEKICNDLNDLVVIDTRRGLPKLIIYHRFGEVRLTLSVSNSQHLKKAIKVMLNEIKEMSDEIDLMSDKFGGIV